MRVKVLMVCSVLMLAAMAVQAQNADVEKAITKMEQQWADASKVNNVDAVAPMLAESFYFLNDDGTVQNKAQSLAFMKDSKWEIFQIGDVKVSVTGNTAIATGTWRGKGVAGGKAVDATDRWVDTWVKMPGGKWQCVASASAPVKM